MSLDIPGPLPRWLLVGILIGLLASTGIALVFMLGRRLYPNRGRSSDAVGFDAIERKRVAVGAYLRAIGERVVEDRVVNGLVVDFYLPARDVAITFDAQTYVRLASSPTVAVLVEDELPVGALGSRLPFDAPTWADPAASRTGARRSPSEHDIGDPAVGDAFATLGLRTDAGRAEIRAAYRERIKTVHPDLGGDREAFRRVHEAYRVALRSAGPDAD